MSTYLSHIQAKYCENFWFLLHLVSKVKNISLIEYFTQSTVSSSGIKRWKSKYKEILPIKITNYHLKKNFFIQNFYFGYYSILLIFYVKDFLGLLICFILFVLYCTFLL